MSGGLTYRVVAESLAVVLLLVLSGLTTWSLLTQHEMAIEIATLKAERSAECRRLDELKDEISSLRVAMEANFKVIDKRLTDYMLRHVAEGE